MANVELRWSDYRGSVFRIVERVGDDDSNFDSLVGPDLDRDLYAITPGTVIVQRRANGVLEGGQVTTDGGVRWTHIAETPAQLPGLIQWARRAHALHLQNAGNDDRSAEMRGSFR